jgi:hypothetical protein
VRFSEFWFSPGSPLVTPHPNPQLGTNSHQGPLNSPSNRSYYTRGALNFTFRGTERDTREKGEETISDPQPLLSMDGQCTFSLICNIH